MRDYLVSKRLCSNDYSQSRPAESPAVYRDRSGWRGRDEEAVGGILGDDDMIVTGGSWSLTQYLP